MTQALMATYSRLPVTFERGEGVWLWDTGGRKYLDALSGIAVCSLGHAHPAVTATICQQASTLIHTSNVYGITQQQQLGEALTRLSGMDNVFFSNSGAEANEAAIKLARLHGHARGINEPAIIVMDNSFHGRTMATLTATGNRKVQAGFEPLVKGFVRVPYGDIDAILHVAETSTSIAAVLVEPVQGEGGVNIPPGGYLAAIREICDRKGWLMMLDEIQTGMSRTGSFFAFQQEGIVPDVMTLAKALGNGMPIGACLARGEAASLFAPGNHGSTFGGNPLACATALTVINTMQELNLPEKAAQLGNHIASSLRAALDGFPAVTDIRNRGCMIGIELDRPCGELVGKALAQGLLINVTAGNVIRLLPPLVMSNEEADQLVTGLAGIVKEFLA
ncbi:MAG: aspartate aminotransferase family protein [Gammaproteobacteria bacterium]|jgi:acetylornithine/N-succinyldiaminopimelate aminotransferase